MLSIIVLIINNDILPESEIGARRKIAHMSSKRSINAHMYAHMYSHDCMCAYTCTFICSWTCVCAKMCRKNTKKKKIYTTELFYITTQSYTTYTILPRLRYVQQSFRCYCAPPLFWQEISSTKVYWPLACVLLLLYPARALMVSIMLADLLCPTSRSPSSLIWNKIHYNSRGAAHPLRSGRKAATPR